MIANNKNEFVFDFDEFRQLFDLKSKKKFEFYLENIFQDFSSIKDGKYIGISKLRFLDWLKLPMFICEKLFISFDKDKDEFLSLEEVKESLTKLYFGTFEDTLRIIFNLYDFDHNGIVSLSNIKTIMQFLPLKNEKTIIEYKYQLESQHEIDFILFETFGNKQFISFEDFVNGIQIKSDIYLQIMCYLYQKCPLKEKNIKNASKLIYSSHKDLNGLKLKSPRTDDKKKN